MSGLIGGACPNCQQPSGNCRCKLVKFKCAAGHVVTEKVSMWTGKAAQPHHCEDCYLEWLAATFPMKKVK